MATREEYLAVRNVIQYVLVPTIFVIGFLGNAVSILVLTRKRMRCSTNIYLTGLAVADIVYLSMLLIMSAEHYKATEQIGIFWRCRGLFQWLIDGSSYISLYIVVCFTIERYIAVCHPMKGQVFCTEERAKKVLAVVVIIILLSILSANFEFELVENKCLVNNTNGQKCDISKLNQTEFLLMQSSSSSLNQNNDITTTIMKLNIPDEECDDDEHSSTLSPPLTITSSSPLPLKSSASTEFKNDNDYDGVGVNKNIVKDTVSATTSTKAFMDDSIGCHYIKKYRTKASALGSNRTYRQIFDLFTIFFYSALPLILIIIFNTFLIRAVHKSNLIRKNMTNMSVRQIKHQQQENKITIILIAVVILFIICQTPWAIYLFLDNFSSDLMDDYTRRICGNVFNTLVAIDAASNFILYCLLSDKYRKTLKELIMGYKYKRQDTLLSRQGTLASSWYNYSYKSFKKQNSIDTHTSQSRCKDERTSIKSSQKPHHLPSQPSSSSPSAMSLCISQRGQHTPSASDTISTVNLSGMSNNRNNNNNINDNDNGNNIIPTSKNTTVRNKKRQSISFRHKLPDNYHTNTIHNLQLRPTVSFRNTNNPSSSSQSSNTIITPAEAQSHNISVPASINHSKLFTFNEGKPITGSTITTPELENNNSSNQDDVKSELSDTISGKSKKTNNHHNLNIMMNILKSPNDTSGNLTRSQSLIIQPKTKHSPDCPNFDSNF